MTAFDVLRKFDAYPKTVEDLRVRTVGGAAVTILSTILTLILIVGEINSFMSLRISEELFVDTTRNHKLRINLDIYVPTISCPYLSLDAMDSSGDQHLHIEHNIYKRRVDLQGNPIDEARKEDIQQTTTTTTTTSAPDEINIPKIPACGSCYGAQLNETQCCNTCQEVIDAYHERRWNPSPENFEQCQTENVGELLDRRSALNEGCQIYGHMEVNRMGGSFHVAPGKSFSLNHIHVHDVQPFTSSSFNTSHQIKHLSFGDKIDFANTHPLDGMDVVTKEGATMFQYYIKIVPTMYVKVNGDVVNTNQFSVTRHSKKVSVISGETGMPGVFFSYELSPLMVKYTEKHKSFGHFATNICVIIGGIFTVASILDGFLHNYVIRKKIELGKLS